MDRRIGIPRKALAELEHNGVAQPAGRDDDNHPLYDEAEIERLREELASDSKPQVERRNPRSTTRKPTGTPPAQWINCVVREISEGPGICSDEHRAIVAREVRRALAHLPAEVIGDEEHELVRLSLFEAACAADAEHCRPRAAWLGVARRGLVPALGPWWRPR